MSIASNSTSLLDQPLQERYTKIAYEYQKVRKQVQILKEAVKEERKQREEISESAQTTIRQCRKLESEVESLTFRNDQLAKRIELLQNEIDHTNRKSKRMSKSKSAYGNMENGIAFEVVPEEINMKALEDDLKYKVLETERLNVKIANIEWHHEREKMELNEKIIQLMAQLEANKNLKPSTSQIISSNPQSATQTTVKEENKSLNPFDNEEDADRESTPSLEKSLQYRCQKTNFTNSIIEYYSSMLQHLESVLTNIKSEIAYEIYIIKDDEMAEKLETAITELSNELTTNNLNLVGNFVTKINKLPSGTTVIDQNSIKIIGSYLNDWYEKFAIKMSLNSTPYQNYVSQLISFIDKLLILQLSFDDSYSTILLDSIKSLVNTFEMKIAIERPTNDRKLKSTNECLAANFNSIRKSAVLLDDIYQSNRHVMTEMMSASIEEPKLTNISQEASEEVKQKIEKLQEEVKIAKEQLFLATKEREKSNMEIGLLKMKLQRAEELVAHQESQQKNERNPESIVQSDSEYAEQYYTQRVMQAQEQEHEWKDCAEYWQNECEELLRQTLSYEDQINDLDATNERLLKELNDIKEELQSTRRNYEEQLHSMTEHMGQMNSRLTEQSDQLVQMRNGAGNEQKKMFANRRSFMSFR